MKHSIPKRHNQQLIDNDMFSPDQLFNDVIDQQQPQSQEITANIDSDSIQISDTMLQRYQKINQKRTMRKKQGRNSLKRTGVTQSCVAQRKNIMAQSTRRRYRMNKQPQESISTNSSKLKNGFFNRNDNLQNVLQKQKIKKIVKNFLQTIKPKKITQNVQKNYPRISNEDKQESGIQGFKLSQNLSLILDLIYVIITLLMIFINTIRISFKTNLGQIQVAIKIIAICFYSSQILAQIFTTKQILGKEIFHLQKIWKTLSKKELFLSLINMLFILFDVIFIHVNGLFIIRAFILSRVPHFFQKVEKLETKIIKTNVSEQWWSLIKILLFNFTFAHILAVCLAGIAVGQQHSWLTKKQIQNETWFVQYVWAYYWGTNIMLTVGFGDITAQTDTEAMWLVFIQTFSCVILAYNVNCVGDIIMRIKSKDLQKKQKLRTFGALSASSDISQELKWKVTNHIDQSINLQKNFNFSEQHVFIQSLPQYLKNQFLRQYNKKMFLSIPFFRYLMQKTIYSLAEKVQMKMAHPQQIIRGYKQDFNILIVRNGVIATVCAKGQSLLDNLIIDRIQVSKSSLPFLVSLNFITLKHLFFKIKSLQYCSIFTIDFIQFLQIIKQYKYDFEYYCFLRDKMSTEVDQFQVLDCQICEDKSHHYKFDCPLMHYIPNKGKIIYKQQLLLKNSKEYHRRACNRKNISFNTLQIYKFYHINNQSQLLDIKLITQANTIDINQISIYDDKDLYSAKKISSMDKQLSDLRQLIKTQIKHIKKQSIHEDPMWQIQTDILKDFTRYFPNSNPNALHTIFSEQKQIKKLLANVSKRLYTKGLKSNKF